MKQKLTGARLLKAAVNQILEHPETWDQETFHCGTKRCIVGWCQELSGKRVDRGDSIREVAQEAVGLTDAQAGYLFHELRTLEEIYYFAKHFGKKVELTPFKL